MKDNRYWKNQITKSLDCNKNFFKQAKDTIDEYEKETSYNILYSNVHTLQANLLPNNPKPDIQRRFLKKTEEDKLRYNTYLEVAKVVEGCVSYYSDIAKVEEVVKNETLHNSLLAGRGVSWIEYVPTIEAGADGVEDVTKQEIKVVSLAYNEFLTSKADKESEIWWKARKHRLTKKNLKEQFDYDYDNEETVEEDDNNELQDVWEIWDKTGKKRIYVLMSSTGDDPLKVTDDPYRLEVFFPCVDLNWLLKDGTVIPIPEYNIYKEKARLLDKISKKSDNLEKVIKFVLTTNNANKDNTSSIVNAAEGDVIPLDSQNPLQDGVNTINMIPVDGAINLAVHRENKKQILKQDIYDVTGISDIARGQTDAQETATAQKIKGVFGSLRFQDRQKKVQMHIKTIYAIISELVCEHIEPEEMSAITCTYLPTAEEKQNIEFRLAQQQALQNNPQAQQVIQVQPVTQQEIDKLDEPTWDDLLQIMRNDKLRNYTIDIESNATVFDDKVQQQADLQALSNSYIEVIKIASELQDPNIIKGYLPIAKMQLTNIKTGRALAQQLSEALEQGIRDLEQPKEPNPAEGIALQKAQLDMQKTQSEIQDKQARTQIDMQAEANKSKELQLKTMEAQEKIRLAQQKALQENQVNMAGIQNDNRNTDIKQQDADRKDRELEAETQIAVAEIVTGVQAPTIAGDVGSVG